MYFGEKGAAHSRTITRTRIDFIKPLKAKSPSTVSSYCGLGFEERSWRTHGYAVTVRCSTNLFISSRHGLDHDSDDTVVLN